MPLVNDVDLLFFKFFEQRGESSVKTTLLSYHKPVNFSERSLRVVIYETGRFLGGHLSQAIESRYAHPKKLVEIIGVDSKKFDSFNQWDRRISGFF